METAEILKNCIKALNDVLTVRSKEMQVLLGLMQTLQNLADIFEKSKGVTIREEEEDAAGDADGQGA